jgi:CRISPR system Cascade subunit CasD
VTVALSFETDAMLETVSSKLKQPERPLFIGRKACPPSRPIFEAVVEADSLFSALKAYTLSDALPAGQKIAVRTEAAERELIDGPVLSQSLRDLKNWTNNYHSTNRPVVECQIEVA